MCLGQRSQLNSWRDTALHSLAPHHTCLEVSSNPEDRDYLDPVSLIRVGAELCGGIEFETSGLGSLSCWKVNLLPSLSF